jgi:opacity protein-like surface antigen
MKRIITLVLLAVAMTVSAQAQGIKFGLKGGLNITKMSFSEDVIKSDNKTGFFVGPTVKVSLPAGFGADIAALYDQRSADVTGVNSNTEATSYPASSTATTETIKQKSIQIPVNLRYNIGLSSMAGIYLAAGPQFGFPVSDKVYNTKVGEYRLKDASLSINFGAGLSLMGHLEVGFTYNLAAGKSGEFKDWNDVDTHNNAWQISAAYYF